MLMSFFSGKKDPDEKDADQEKDKSAEDKNVGCMIFISFHLAIKCPLNNCISAFSFAFRYIYLN